MGEISATVPPGARNLIGITPRCADNFTTVFCQVDGGHFHVVDFDTEVMDARADTGRAGLGRIFAVVFDQSEVNDAVTQVTRHMVADLAGLHFDEPKSLFVKLRGLC